MPSISIKRRLCLETWFDFSLQEFPPKLINFFLKVSIYFLDIYLKVPCICSHMWNLDFYLCMFIIVFINIYVIHILCMYVCIECMCVYGFETGRGHESEIEFKGGGGIGSVIEYIQ